MRNSRKKSIIISSLFLIALAMLIGYAAFSTKLNIKGTADISSKWDIKITSVTVLNTNGTAENVKNAYTDLTANLEANLYNKGDYVEYKIIVENSGDFDAKLDTLGITNSNNEAIKITASGFTKGQTLYKKTTEALTVKIEYDSNYDGKLGTSGESNITLGFTQNEGGTITPTKDHLVTYDYTTNGGESTTAENEYLAEGSNINLSYTASKKDYEFLGWSQSATSTTPLESLTMGSEDIVLYAIFKIVDTTPPVIDNISYTSTTNSITVAVTASDSDAAITKYEYSINDGEYVTGDKNYTFTGLTQNTSYKIKVRVTNEAGLQTEKELGSSGKTTSDLKTELVSSGDGLYIDTTTDGRYIYRGANVNNYITFNNETWRIMSIESDGTLKIVRNEQISGAYQWDDAGNRNSSTSTYCTNANNCSCNAWAATKNLVGTPSSYTQYSPNGNTSDSTTYSGTVTSDSTMATYLNGTYYNSLSSDAKSKVVKGTFNVSTPGNSSDTETLETDAEQEKQYQWKGYVALYTVTELLRASTDSSCTSLNAGYNSNKSSSCKNNNWLWPSTSGEWTLSPSVDSSSITVWTVQTSGYIGAPSANNAYYARPVLHLSSGITLSGSGTSSDPYTIVESPKIKALDVPTYSENNTTVTITYPSGCGSDLTCTYSKDSGEEVTVTSSSASVNFTKDGTLVAKVSDGVNTVSSSYTYTVKSIDATKETINASQNSGYYSCPSGGSLSGTKCTTSSSYSASYESSHYYCPSGGTLTGTQCYNEWSYSPSTTTTTSCCLEWGSESQCGYTQSECNSIASQWNEEDSGEDYYCSCSTTTTETCNSGDTLISGGYCYGDELVNASYSSGGYYCPNGGSLSGTTCTKTSSYSATYNEGYYYCPSGYTSSGSGSSMKCTKYTCPSGYTLKSDNKCYLN